MRRLLAAVLAAFMLVAAPLQPADAITDQGNPAMTRLWSETSEGDYFTCSASYIFPYINDQISWIVTAGHCIEADYVKRNADVTILGMINWRGVTLGDPRYTAGFNDLAIGTVPDMRSGPHTRLWLADEMPKSGAVYIHGFPAGVERISLGYVIPADSPELPGGVLVAVKAGEIVGGSSGSPVLRADGRLVGILWGVLPEKFVNEIGLPGTVAPGYDLAVVTPVEKLHELMKLIGVK